MSVYYLTKYNISLPYIRKLEESNITLEDIHIMKDKAFNTDFNCGRKKIQDIIDATELFYQDNLEPNVYILLKYGLSKNICDQLVNKNITLDLLNKSTENELMTHFDFSQSTASKLLASLTKYNEDNDSLQVEKDYTHVLKMILEKILTPGEVISIDNLHKILSFEKYSLKYLDNDLDYLKRNNVIIFSSDKISYNFIHLIDYIDNNIKGNKITIIKERLSGLTLEEIGESFGITRERVRQITKNEFDKFPKIFEDKYINVFEEYDWNIKDFTAMFNENDLVYNYLNLRYLKGTKPLYELLNDDITIEQSNYLRKKYKIENVLGEEIVIDRNEVLRVIIKKYAQNKIKIEDICSIYNEYVNTKLTEYNILNFDTRTIEGVTDRLNVAVFSLGKYIRYYDLDELDKEEVNLLKSSLNLDDGFYSSKYIFDTNKDLMDIIDIHDEYELHNLLKRLFNKEMKNIKFEKMPNLLIGISNKDTFILNKIHELAPISFNDFIEMLEVDYGHKSNTMVSYVSSKFKNYIVDRTIISDISELSDDNISNIINQFTEGIYSARAVKEILLNNGFDESYYNRDNIGKLGYIFRNKYILTDKYTTLEDYLYQSVINNDYLKTNLDYYNVSSFYFEIYKLKNNLDIIKTSDDEYITIKKLNSLSITKDLLHNIINDVIKLLKDKEYISLKDIKDITNQTKLKEYNFSDIFYESLVLANNKIKKIKIYNNLIFTLDSDKNKYDFINYVITKYNIGDITLLIEILKEEYGVEITYYRLKKYIVNKGIKLKQV